MSEACRGWFYHDCQVGIVPLTVKRNVRGKSKIENNDTSRHFVGIRVEDRSVPEPVWCCAYHSIVVLMTRGYFGKPKSSTSTHYRLSQANMGQMSDDLYQQSAAHDRNSDVSCLIHPFGYINGFLGQTSSA